MVTDLRSSGFGFEWGQSRGYANQLNGSTDSPVGQQWFVNQLSYLVFNAGTSGDRIVVMSGADTSLWFVPDGSGWAPEFALRTKLVLDPESGDYVLSLPSGQKRHYFSNSAANGAALGGRLRSITNPDGSTATLGYDDGGTLDEFRWAGNGSSGAYIYTYYTAADGAANAGRYKGIARQLDGADVERVSYTFHQGTDPTKPFGNAGDLQTATIEEWNSADQTWILRRNYYYRYYTSTETVERNGETVVIGFKHGLKYVLSTEGLAQMERDGKDQFVVSDSILAPFADKYFEFNSEKRVSQERVRGGTKEYTFDYLTAAVDPGLSDKNTWHRKTSVTFPDGTTRTVYSTSSGQVILSKLENAAKTRAWYRHYHFDSAGHIDLKANAAAIDNANVIEPSSNTGTLIVALWENKGLVETFAYYPNSDVNTGAASGYMSHQAVQKGSAGGPAIQQKYFYGQHSIGDYTVFPLVKRISFPTAGMAEADAPTVHYQFTYHGGGTTGSTGSTPIVEIEANANNDPSADTVYEQAFTEYDAASNTIYGTSFQRFHDATGLGELGGPAQSQKPKGRRTYSAVWPDGIGRIWAAANFGTEGSADLVRPPVVPNTSTFPHALVSTTEFGADGLPFASIDPIGVRNETLYDKLGRSVEIVENVSATTGSDTNRKTQTKYKNGFSHKLILINPDTNTNPPTTSDEQVTEWQRGFTSSIINSNRILATKKYPNGDHTDYSDYNRQGQLTKIKDGMAERILDYDKFGTLIHDRVSAAETDTDQSILRLSYTYSPQGQLATATSYNNADINSGTAVNQVALDYDSFGNLKKDSQAHESAVTGGTPAVSYVHANGSNNTTRRQSIQYPGGRNITVDYATGMPDDRLSRVSGLISGTETSPYASYTYLGLSSNVRTRYNTADAEFSLISSTGQPGGDAGDPYTGVDRFGRMIDIRWFQTTMPSNVIDRSKYSYDKASRRETFELDLTAAVGQDQAFTYDGLSQVKTRELGELSGGAIGGIPKQKETFTYDPTGNWNQYLLQNINTAGTGLEDTLDQDRDHNSANQITKFDGSSNLVDYDLNGNATKMPPAEGSDWSAANKLTWDAWSRLVKVTDQSNNPVAEYAYDPFTRRTKKTSGAGSPRHLYYNDSWRQVEERPDSESNAADRLYLWGAQSRYELIRQENIGTTGSGSSGGGGGGSGSSSSSTSTETLYFTYSAMDPSAVFTAGAVVKERYRYTAFGKRQVLAPNFAKRTASSHGIEFAFHSEFLDTDTGQYNYGYRYYSPAVGKWPSRDPIGESGGVNLYGFIGNNGLNRSDFLGERILVAGDTDYHQVRENSRRQVTRSGTREFTIKIVLALRAGVQGIDPKTGKKVVCLKINGQKLDEKRGWKITWKKGPDYDKKICKDCPNVKRLEDLLKSELIVKVHAADFQGRNSRHSSMPIGPVSNTLLDTRAGEEVKLYTQNPDGSRGPKEPIGFGTLAWHEIVGHGGLWANRGAWRHPKKHWNDRDGNDGRVDPVIAIENEYRKWIKQKPRYRHYYPAYMLPESTDSTDPTETESKCSSCPLPE